MSWATEYVNKLKKGETVQFRPKGNSMSGLIESGQLCTVKPIKDYDSLKVKDIVLCRVGRNYYLHLISKISGDQFEISNNKGYTNGWIGCDQIFGKYVR